MREPRAGGTGRGGTGGLSGQGLAWSLALSNTPTVPRPPPPRLLSAPARPCLLCPVDPVGASLTSQSTGFRSWGHGATLQAPQDTRPVPKSTLVTSSSSEAFHLGCLPHSLPQAGGRFQRPFPSPQRLPSCCLGPSTHRSWHSLARGRMCVCSCPPPATGSVHVC